MLLPSALTVEESLDRRDTGMITPDFLDDLEFLQITTPIVCEDYRRNRTK